MPTYEYACQSCGNHVEVYQRFSDPPLSECGICGGPLRKVFHPAGILFKGSGFYATDHRRSASSSSERKESASSSTSEGGSGSSGSKKESSGSKPASSDGGSSSSSSSKERSA